MNPNMFRFGSEILGGTAVQSSILGTELTNYGIQFLRMFRFLMFRVQGKIILEPTKVESKGFDFQNAEIPSTSLSSLKSSKFIPAQGRLKI